ncbi:MAG: nucleotidyltransferase [Bacteroidetes bacterium]|jgi:predicted nucleotidyltransferase|nr:nucleotidyltransferase [Bacteroidota bacterium]
MKTSSDIEKQLLELKPVLIEKFKVSKIGVFGSYAKGEQSDASDVDILVDLQEPLGWAFFELKDFLESHLNRSVDLVTRNALKKQLKESILSETKFV